MKKRLRELAKESLSAYTEGRYDLDPEAQRALYTLGLTPDSSFDAVRRRFYSLSRECHPDTGEHPSTERFTRIKEAYDVLKTAYRMKDDHE